MKILKYFFNILFILNIFVIISCASTPKQEELPEEKQPGTHVRRVNGKELNDDEMIEYYCNLLLMLHLKSFSHRRNL